MAFGTLQSVLLALGVEVWTCGFEIGSIALGVLVDVDTVIAGREVVEVELEADARSFRRHDDRAYGFTLRVLEFDYGFGGAGKGGDGQDYGEGDEGESKMFHAGIIANLVVSVSDMHQRAMPDPRRGGVYCGKV